MTSNWITRAQNLSLQVSDLIAGKRVGPSGSTLVSKYSPRDGRLLCEWPMGSMVSVQSAVSEARVTFRAGAWSKRSLSERRTALERVATFIEQHADELALLESLDVGKPVHEALTADVPMAAAAFREAASSAEHVYGRVLGVDAASLSYELRRPLGVVGAVVGWNFPLVLAASKIAPALAMGNSIVLKPSELTSFSSVRLAELVLEAGVPAGAIGIIHGDGAVGDALARHPDVDLLSFTGSSLTGKRILVASGQSNMKRTLLECGGKAPGIVFEDCPDLEKVAEGVIRSAFWNQGQVCTASSRLLVQEPIKKPLLSVLAKKLDSLVAGDPLDPETRFGAVVSRPHQEKVERYVKDAQRAGADVAYRSAFKAPFPQGYYVPPMLVDRVTPHQSLAQEEVFGPVLAVITFKSDQEAIHLANDTIYGLSATVWTQNLARAHRIAYEIDAGSIVIRGTAGTGNAAGGAVLSTGGHKQSGLGVEGGIQGLEAYTSLSAVQIVV